VPTTPSSPAPPPASGGSSSGGGGGGSTTPRKIVLAAKLGYTYEVTLEKTYQLNETPDFTLDKGAGAYEVSDIEKAPIDFYKASELYTTVMCKAKVARPNPPQPPPAKIGLTLTFMVNTESAVARTHGDYKVDWDMEVVCNAFTAFGVDMRMTVPQRNRITPGMFAPGVELTAKVNQKDYNDPDWQKKVVKDTYWQLIWAKVKYVQVAQGQSGFEETEAGAAVLKFENVRNGAGYAKWHPDIKAKLDNEIPAMDKTNEIKQIIARLFKAEFGLGTSDASKMQKTVEMLSRKAPLAGVLVNRAGAISKFLGLVDFVGLMEKIWIPKLHDDTMCGFLGAKVPVEGRTVDKHGEDRAHGYEAHQAASGRMRAAETEMRRLSPQLRAWANSRAQFPYLPESAGPYPEYQRQLTKRLEALRDMKASMEPVKKTERAFSGGLSFSENGVALQGSAALESKITFPLPVGVPYLGGVEAEFGFKVTLGGMLPLKMETGTISVPGVYIPTLVRWQDEVPNYPAFPLDFGLPFDFAEVVPPRDVTVFYPAFSELDLALKCEGWGALGITILYGIHAKVGTKPEVTFRWNSNDWDKVLINVEWKALYFEFSLEFWLIFKMKLTVNVVIIKAPGIQVDNGQLSRQDTKGFQGFLFGVKVF